MVAKTGRQLVAGILTQMLLSLTSFAVGLGVARLSSKDEYGAFVAAFTVLGGLVNIQNALTNTPMTVLLRDRPVSEENSFVTGIALAQLFVFVPGIAAVLLVVYTVPEVRTVLGPYSMATTAAVAAWLLREFVRSMRIADLKLGTVAAMDASCALGTLGTGLALAWNGAFDAQRALLVLAAGGFVGAAVGYTMPGRRLGYSPRIVMPAVREAWPLAKWAIVGVAAGILQSRGYVFVAGSQLGLDGLANIAAARLFLMPIGLVIASTTRIVVSQVTSLRDGEPKARLRRFVLAVGAFISGLWLVYVVVLEVLHRPFELILGPKYLGIGGLVDVWAAYFLIQGIRVPITSGLIALKELKRVAWYDVAAGAVTLVSCLILGASFGAEGVIGGLVTGEVALLALSSFRMFAGSKT